MPKKDEPKEPVDISVGEIIDNGPVIDGSTPLIVANQIKAKEEAEEKASELLNETRVNTSDNVVMNPRGITVRISGDRYPTSMDLHREQAISHAVIVGGYDFQDGAILDDQNPKPLRGDHPSLLVVTLLGCTGFPYRTQDAEPPDPSWLTHYYNDDVQCEMGVAIPHVTWKQIDALIDYIAVKCKRYGIDPEESYRDENIAERMCRVVHGENELYPDMFMSPGLNMNNIIETAIARMKAM